MSGRHTTGLAGAHTGDRGCGSSAPTPCRHASTWPRQGAGGSSSWTSHTHGRTGAGELDTLWHGTTCALERTELPQLDCRTQGAAGPSRGARGVLNSGLSERGTGDWVTGRQEIRPADVIIRALPPSPGRWPLKSSKGTECTCIGETLCPDFLGRRAPRTELSSEQTGWGDGRYLQSISPRGRVRPPAH